MVPRKNIELSNLLRIRSRKELEGEEKKLLSKGGKKILIKEVAEALLTYSMSCFKIPHTLCDYMEKLMCGFWWEENEKKIHWLGWARMRWPKKC